MLPAVGTPRRSDAPLLRASLEVRQALHHLCGRGLSTTVGVYQATCAFARASDVQGDVPMPRSVCLLLRQHQLTRHRLKALASAAPSVGSSLLSVDPRLVLRSFFASSPSSHLSSPRIALLVTILRRIFHTRSNSCERTLSLTEHSSRVASFIKFNPLTCEVSA